MKHFKIALAFCLITCYGNSQDSIALNQRALAILQACLKAHGGTAATDSLRISFRAVSKKFSTPGQSFAANEAVDEYNSYFDYIIDRPSKKEIAGFEIGTAGFTFHSLTFPQNNKWINISNDRKVYSEAPGTNSQGIFFFPQNMILNSLKNPSAVYFGGERTLNGQDAYLLIRRGGGGQLFIDKKTNLLLQFSQAVHNRAYGDAFVITEYYKYTQIGSIIMPMRIKRIAEDAVTGKSVNEFELQNVTANPKFDPSISAIPAGFAKADFSYRKKTEVLNIADNIYLIENASETPPAAPFSYNTAFAVFNDFIFVLEAPWDEATSERVIKKIKESFPTKPIKYVLETHHHEDHIGGLRRYIAEGAIIVTSPSNAESLNKLAKAPFTISPDLLSRHPRNPDMELVTKQKKITDNTNEAVIYQLGSNDHSKEMLFVYFPKQKFLFQGDLVNEGEYPTNKTTQQFIVKVKKLGIKPEWIAGVHGKSLTKEEVAQLLK